MRQIALKLPTSSGQACIVVSGTQAQLLRLHNSVHPHPMHIRSRRSVGTAISSASHHLLRWRLQSTPGLPWRSISLPELLVFGFAVHGIRRMGLSSCSLSPRKLTTGSIALSQPLESVWIAVLGE